MTNIIVDPKTGKPMFIGKEDPNNPPVPPRSQGSKIMCPVCSNEVEYLVGEDTQDGGRKGCEACYKPPTKPITVNDAYDTTKEIV